MKLKHLFETISIKLETNENTTLADCYSILDEIKESESKDWKEYCQFSEETYTRNLVFRNNFLDCYILCWLPNQGTPYHYHPSRGCIYRILKGELVETRETDKNKQNTSNQNLKLDTDKETNKIITNLTKDMCGYIGNEKGGHQIKNSSNQPAVSLHFYAPAKYYD